MGGNAFKHMDLVRVAREDVPATAAHVVDTLSYPGFDYNYAMSALMGSGGKSETSGDLDFCMNTHEARFVGEVVRPVFDKHAFKDSLYAKMPGTSKHPKGSWYNEHVNMSTFKMGNLMTAWPVAGDPAKGYVQVDFVFGKFDLLQFTHWSPGPDSEFKGVFVSQGLGVLAKMKKDFEAKDPVTNERTGRVGLHLSLEEGLFRKWEARRRPGMGCSVCTADYFETRFPECPRFSRIGFVDNPDAVVEMVVGKGVKHSDVNTFEKLVEHVRTHMPDRYGEFWERFMESAGGSGIAKQNGYDPVEVALHPLWRAKDCQ